MKQITLLGTLLFFYLNCFTVFAQELKSISIPTLEYDKDIPTIEINSTTVSENVTSRKGRLSKAVSATEVAIYQTSNTPEDPKIARINGSSNSAAPLVGDLIVFDPSTTNRNIRTIVVSLHHPPGVPRQPIDFTLAMYESCPSQSSGTQGFACGSGSNIIPGSSFTETFTPPSDGVYNMVYTYDTPVNVYNKGDEIAIMFKAVSVAPVNFILNTPIVIGRQPAGEPSEGSIAWCGESLTYSGCRIAEEGLLHNNFSIIVFAESESNPPIAKCKPSTVVLSNFGLGTLNPENINDGSFDPEGFAISLSVNKPSFGCSNIGENTVTLTVTDAAGNESTCTTIVTVESPGISLVCPNRTFEVDENSCTKKYNFNTVAQGLLCSPITIVQTQGPPSGSELPVGVTTFAFKATNEIGDEATCSYTVTVTDKSEPGFLASCGTTITSVNTPGECGKVVNYVTPTAIDNCLESTVQTTGLPSGAFFPIGVTTNTFVATDQAGNVKTCTIDVVIVNTEPLESITAPDNFIIESFGTPTLDEKTTTISYTGSPQSWEDDATGKVATLTAKLAGIPDDAVIVDVNVGVKLDQSYLTDVRLILESPIGTKILLLNAGLFCEGEEAYSDNISALFDDSALNFASEICGLSIDTGENSENCEKNYLEEAAVSGLIKPDNPLSPLHGENPAGTWKLYVDDYYTLDGGCIQTFYVQIT